MNSKQKGKRGELELASYLRDQGFKARRGQQFHGGADAPDVVSDFPLHIEVKRVERLQLRDAIAQAEGDSANKNWVVAHKFNHGQWLAILKMDVLCDLIRKAGYESDTSGTCECGQTACGSQSDTGGTAAAAFGGEAVGPARPEGSPDGPALHHDFE